MRQANFLLIHHTHARQVEVARLADVASNRAERVIRRQWNRLLRVLASKAMLPHKEREVRQLLFGMPTLAGFRIAGDLTQVATWGYRSAVAGIKAGVPEPVLAELAQDKAARPVREAKEQQAKTGTLPSGKQVKFIPHGSKRKSETTVMVDPAKLDAAWQADSGYLPPESTGQPGSSEVGGRREGFKRFLETGKRVQASRVYFRPRSGNVTFDDGRHRFAVLRDKGINAVAITVPRSQAAKFLSQFGVDRHILKFDLQAVLFPAFTAAQVEGVVYRGDWQGRLHLATKLALPDHLATIITSGLVLGKTHQEIARDLRPAVQGVIVSARRIARTECLRVANKVQFDAHKQLGDLVIGYRVLATLDQHTRPWHASRSGTVYYINPGPGQKGLAQMPHPPDEADDPSERPAGTPHTAWNCRCWLVPVLRSMAGWRSLRAA